MDNQVYQFNQESWNAMGMDPEQQIDDQAYMALRLSKKLNEQVEIVAADLDKSAQSGFPVNFFKRLDNAELPDNYSKEMLSKSISPLLKRTIATNPERAGFFTGDQLEKWNAVMREAEDHARHQRYIDTVLDRIQQEKKSPGDEAFERWQSVNDMRKRQETWKQIQDQAQINKVVNALDAYWPTDFRKENDSVLDARLEILNTMGIDTSMVDRDELRKTKGYQFREAVNIFGVLDAMENGDNLGWLIANKMTDGAAVDLLSHVDENSPLFVQEKALELLRKERYDAMPETGMEKAFNTLFKSTAFMTEMALTSGMGEAFGLVKAGGAPMLDQLVKDGFLKFIRENGLKGFGQAVKEGMKRAGANAVGRLPVYLPSVTLNTFSEVAPSVVTIPDDFGNPSITVKESDVTDFIQRLVTNTVTQSIEMFTEELGPLIPLGDLDAKMITALLPKTVRNFVAQSLIRNPTTRRIAERAILDRVPFDGLIGEFGEEAIGQFMMFGATLLGYGMGFRPENTAGTMSPVMSKEEAGDTLASIALQSVLFRGLQIAHAELTNRGAIAMIRDAQRAKSDRTHFEAMRDLISETRLPQSNVNEAERTLGLLLNGDAVVSVTPESLEGILQQATEGKTEAEANEARATLEQLGVTTDAIENAKKNGTDVLLSRNRLWAVSSNKGFKNAKELVDRILDNEVSEVFGKTTKEITADGFTKEQIDEMVDRSKRQEDFLLDVQKTMSEAIRTAQKNAIAAGNKLGISQQNVQDFVNIYKWMANYLAENVETEEGLAKLKEMVDNLSVQFAEAPEKFDTTAAVSGVAQARVASLERRVADIQSSIDALNSMDYLNDTQISQLEALKDDLEEAQIELDDAKNGALNQVSPVWTGSAASYDQPSLQYVGTGEGAQVFGWGLYGSSSRSVGEWYAKKDVKRKAKARTIKFRGKEINGYADLSAVKYTEFDDDGNPEHRWMRQALTRIHTVANQYPEYGMDEIVATVKDYPVTTGAGFTYDMWGKVVDEVAKDIELVKGDTPKHNLYKQTFWGNKEENLLDWDKHVSMGQIDAIKKQAKKDGVDVSRFNKKKVKIDGVRLSDANGGRGTYDITLLGDEYVELTVNDLGEIESSDIGVEGETLASLLGVKTANKILDFLEEEDEFNDLELKGVTLNVYPNRYTGQKLYEELTAQLGSPKAASEFLYRAGIDGVTYVGGSSGERNYVAFSDKDIRVDEHILFQIVPPSHIKQKRKQKQWGPVYDAYELALRMEGDGASPEMIRQVTGWERVTYGDASLFVYDMPDNYKPSEKLLESMKLGADRSGLTFEKCFETTPELRKLYSLYPYLKKSKVEPVAKVPSTNTKAAIAAYDWYRDIFYLSDDIPEDLIPFVIAHEVQHYIQWTGMGIDDSGDTWSSTPTELNAIDASYRGTLSEEDRRKRTILSTSRDAIEATIAMQKEYQKRKKRIEQEDLDIKREETPPPKKQEPSMTVYVDGERMTDWESSPGLYFIATWIRRGGNKRLQAELEDLRSWVDSVESQGSVPPHLAESLADRKALLSDVDSWKNRVEIEVTQDWTGIIPGGGIVTRRALFQGGTSAVTPEMEEEFAEAEKQGNTILKGQINLARFAQSQEAIISLFKDADASTLPHESAHWLKAAMESLIGAGFATDKMKQDLDTINAWLDKQDYTGAVTDQDKYRAREEYFARAFEQYLREGRFPEAATTGLKSALRRLARMLQSIYRNALALNAPIDDSIRGFFDDIFAVEEVVDGTSVLSGILREINTGALAFSKEDLKKLETAVAGAREDAETEAWLAALQDYQKGLKEQQKLWRNEAKEAYEASKAEQAYTYVRNGHKLDENFLRNVLKLDEETISILKKKRLTYKAAPVETAPAAEAPVEAPVVAETAAPAVEPAPTETPVSTASAEAKAATTLDGTPEQFDALGEDTTISLPEGEEVAQNAVANLVYGPDGKGGAIWKRIKVNPTGAELGDVLYKLYTVALNRLSEPAPITKAGLIGYLSRTAFNTEQQAFRDLQRAPESMDETVFEGKDGDGASRYDVTGRTDFGFTSGDSEAYLTALSDFTETLADGTLKREIADIIYELSDAGEQATNEAIMAEYRQRGGTRQKTSLYDAIKEVRRSIRDYMQNNGFLQSLDVETPASILDTMKELDYGDVNDLITDLRTALGRSAFIKDYMNRKHAEYRNAFLDNPNWASEAGATRYLDAILRALKVTEGMKFSERARIAASEATRELMASANVRDVMNGERGVATSLRSNAAKVLRALKSGKEDKAAAITAALDMYRNDARLRAIRKLRADIQKTLNRAKRIGKSKPGSTLDGDTINAVKALLNRFGMSSAEPQWTTGPGDPQSVLAVMKEFTPDLEAELTHWSSWMNRVLTGEEAKTSWQNLTPEQFYELTDLIDYLRGEGRQSLMDQKGTFASNLKTAMEAILPSVEEHKTGDYTDPADKTMLQKLGSLARSGIHQMKTLVFMAHLLDGRTEFYGDHVIGPVRKFFQLPLSEGASRELFWYQKTSKEIMPHLQALMRSAKERNLLFAVNNPDNRSYTELRGETAAFVLLNAGAVENRQRLMESFGWSEDELNGLLAQFTKEDFEHAEAIWKSLNEMGRELAKVYYRERHYRMPWATPSPISLTLNDGTEILSEGGYYPIAYTYHDSTQGYDPDIMNPFTKPNKPSRPTATFGRTPVLSDLSLLMSPAVVDRSIRENAHYIGMWEPLRMANAIWTNKDFKQAVIRNFSKETYDALKQLMDNVNNPDKGDKGLWKQVANKLGACLATTALGFKITTMAKQYASVTIGAERLGDYFHDAVSFALHDLKGLRRFVNKESPFMRDRYNLMDRDLRVVNTEFKKPIAKAADKYRYAAFWGLKQNDLNVAAVQWYAAFNWALDPKRGMTKDQARAYADDFVASTQGAARTIDTPVVQLETLGRLMTPFFGPACAAANTRLAGLSVFKQMDAGERIAFAVDNFLVPGLVMTLVAAVRGGLLNPDDDDDWDRIRKQSLIALLTEPVSGLPVVQDISDSVVRAAVTGRPVQSGVFEVSLFRPAEDVSREFVNMFRYWNELGYTTYAAASITGMLFGMPVVQVYEDYEKMILWNFGDKSSKPIKKQLQGEKRK